MKRDGDTFSFSPSDQHIFYTFTFLKDKEKQFTFFLKIKDLQKKLKVSKRKCVAIVYKSQDNQFAITQRSPGCGEELQYDHFLRWWGDRLWR